MLQGKNSKCEGSLKIPFLPRPWLAMCVLETLLHPDMEFAKKIAQKVRKSFRKDIQFHVVFWKHYTDRKKITFGHNKYQLWKINLKIRQDEKMRAETQLHTFLEHKKPLLPFSFLWKLIKIRGQGLISKGNQNWSTLTWEEVRRPF